MAETPEEQPTRTAEQTSPSPADQRPSGLHPELEWREVRRGRRPGEQYVRIVRPFARGFQRARPGYLVAREKILTPKTGFARLWYTVRRLLIGPPIPTAHEVHERLSKVKALAVFSSDALSSVAYATEEIMRVLILAGTAALALTLPISLAIVVLIAIVVTSYQQTIRAYPRGGGSYIVASDNLGRLPGLVAASALLIDYTLTVAVSIAAAMTAVTSALPSLYPYKVDFAVFAVILVMLAHLRGIRESGTIFALPTYAFIVSILGLIALGLWRVLTGAPIFYTPPPEATPAEPHPLTLFLILSAFAQGSTALTGIEAVSDGVPAFKPPEWRNARITLLWMGSLLATMFLGISFLATVIGVIPDPHEQESVVSQIARALVGPTWFYYVVQAATMLILVLAANTSFADFPRLASFLARDGFLPRQFAFRGERLAFSTGIIALAVVAILLLVLFEGSVHRLIPLYAVGVFTAFTLSQLGMVQYWRRRREAGWRWRAVINGFGCLATGIVVVVIAVTKFAHGAWMVLVAAPLLILMMLGINRHYQALARALATRPGERVLPENLPPAVIVPVSRLDRPALAALSFARSISPDVTAVHIAFSPEEAEAFRAQWEQYGLNIPLVIVESPYRALVEPLLAYIDAIDKQDPRRPVTVVLAEFVPRHWWEYLLHNQTALRLKFHLFFRPNTIVIDVPYHVGRGFEGEQLERPAETTTR